MPTRSSDTDRQVPESPSPERPPDDLPPPGDDDPRPRPVRITSVSPIGGVLAGGIDATLTGTGFQPGAEVFFGDRPSPEVTVESANTVKAKVPAASQTGTVSVSLVNPDGSSAILAGAFTYVTTEGSLHAEVLGVTPLAVIEDTESEVTIRGRNLIAAFNDGIVALRGPSRVHITSSNFGSSRDEATGIELLTLSVRVTATPPLEQHERMAIQVLASLRPGAANDGVFESSRQMFTVLPRAVPVALAFTANLDPNKPSLVMVAGRNLEGCSLDLGQGATVHLQRSDDQTLAGIVSFADGAPVPESAQLKVLDPAGSEAGRFDLTVAPIAESRSSSAMPREAASSEAASDGRDIGVTLTPVPGQQLFGPTKEDSAVFSLSGQSLSPSFFFGDFEIVIFERDIIIPLFNETRVIPFFDNGVGDVLNDTPVRAEVGKLFPLRGMGLLVSLRVELIIHIEIVLIIGFRFSFSPFGFFNEFFDDFPFAIGSIVISFRIRISVFLLVSFLVALIKPDGSLRTLFFFNLALGFDLIISPDGRRLFDGKFFHKVRHTRIGPRRTTMFPCDGRFQLAEDNGQTEFTDAFGGSVSFYFPRTAGQCCLPWDFDLELVRFEEGGPEETIQGSFRTEFCLNALVGENQIKVIIVSTRTPDGFPPPLRLDVGEIDALTALGQPVDANGDPIPGSERFDLSTTGRVEFYLESPTNDVLNRGELTPGTAIAEEPGNNEIRVKHTTSRVVDPPPDFGFWPGGVVGFEILSFLARGLAPGVRAGNLPVEVAPVLANKITVTMSVVYRDPNNSANLIPVKILDRNEPFDAQREYLLVAKVVMGTTTPGQTLKFTVKTAKLDRAPLAQIAHAGFTRGRDSANASLFFSGGLATEREEGTLQVSASDSGKTLEVAQLKIRPNNVEVDTGGNLTLVMPGHDVGNRDVKLTIELDVTTDHSTTTISVNNKKFDLTIRHPENFEEYLRVFQEVQDEILQPSGLKDFAKTFATQLATKGKVIADIEAFLKQQGEKLWTDALTEIGTRIDDRPLYWTRLRCIAALKAYFGSQNLGQPSTTTIHQFEYPSRGLSTTGRLELEATTLKKAILTGFDPFGLPSTPNRSNPSGLAALAINKKDLGASGDEVHVQTAIVPVRFEDFNNKMIETAISSNLGSVVMVMTCSENSSREFYDVERWAGRRRLTQADDNNAKFISGSGVAAPPNLTGKEFLESTLPYELVITTATDTLSAPTAARPFVTDQSYAKVGGSFPEPEASDDAQKKISWHTKRFQDDLSTGNSIAGSGGNYLSNEIFYRVALERGQSTVASGHFHVIPTGSDPTSTGPRLIAGVTEAVRRMLIAVTQPRLRSAASLQFPKTVVSQTRTLILTARNESTETINVESAEVAAPFGVTLTGTTPIAVPPQGTLTLNLSFTPTAVETFFQAVRIKNTEQRFVLACTLMGEGVATAPAPTISDFNPKSGVLGDTTKITGLDFTGATNVRIGTTSGQGVAFTFVSDTEIEATVDANARTGRIEVETPSGKARSAVNFTVRRPRPPATPFAEELAQRRAELGLTTAQVATQLGTKSGTYRRWERGLDRPSARFRAAIVSFLGHDPDRDPQGFGQQIRAAREGEGLSRGQLALQLGVSSSTVKAWEDGTVSRPSPRVQGIFEDYLNVE